MILVVYEVLLVVYDSSVAGVYLRSTIIRVHCDLEKKKFLANINFGDFCHVNHRYYALHNTAFMLQLVQWQ